MADDQAKIQNTTDDTAANTAPSDVQTPPGDVSEPAKQSDDTETVIEEPIVEESSDEKEEDKLAEEKIEEPEKESEPKTEELSYDALPTETPAPVDTKPELKEEPKAEVTDDAENPSAQTAQEVDAELASDSPGPKDNPNAKWYVVHTYSGHENKVAAAVKQRVESEHLEHKIIDVLVPTQDKIEIKAGKKENIKEKIFPGYILVKMVLDDASWLAVRTTQGVTSFVGIGNKPTPIPEHEVKTIVRFMSQGATSTFKDVYQVNDTIKIVDGPFSDFIGKVDTVDKEKGKVRVLVSIFGRETPVELDFLQVQKL